MNIAIRTLIYRDGKNIIAHTPELNLSSWGSTKDEAMKNLREAVQLYCEAAKEENELMQVLEDAGYGCDQITNVWHPPELIELQEIEVEIHEDNNN
ncbi:MAG: type II toxin-antitoxin system HicB family antitoxin [bacterium]|nr:type II toxin-antitoxin system HicB family antitoxin [bacterium]